MKTSKCSGDGVKFAAENMLLFWKKNLKTARQKVSCLLAGMLFDLISNQSQINSNWLSVCRVEIGVWQ